MKKQLVTLAASLVLAQFSNEAFAQQAAPAAWGGWARCQVSVQGPGYTDQQTHTWTITGGTPTAQGAFQIYAGTWTVVGGGSLSRSQGTQTLVVQWATNGPGISAPIAVFVRASDRRMFIQARHAQLRSRSAIQGYQQVTIAGRPQTPGKIDAEAFEWAFPVVEVSAPVAPDTNARATGSSTSPVNGGVGLMQPGGSQGTASCTWQFGQGSAAPEPPPTLTAQAVPTPGNPATTSPPANNPPVASTPPANTTPPGTTTPPGSSTPPVSGSSSHAAARLVSVAPASLEQGVSLSGVITVTGAGTHWQEGSTVNFGPGIAIQGGVRVLSPTSLTTQLTVSYAATSGPRAVTVTTGNETVTLPTALTIAAREQPVITQISPDNAAAGAQNVTVTFTGRGTRWEQGKTALILNNAVGVTQAGALSVTSPTSMTVSLNIASSAAPGPREITVLNAGVVVGSDIITLAGGFNVSGPLLTAIPIDPQLLPLPQLAGQITVISPNGGESLAAGRPGHILWRHTVASGVFDIDISTDRGVTWSVLASRVTPRRFNQLPEAGGPDVFGDFYPMPSTSTSTAQVRVRASGQTTPNDVSDATFNLTIPAAQVNKPVAGERWKIGSKPSPEIAWTHNLGANGNFWISLSRDGGQTWEVINGWGLNSSGTWHEVSGPPTTRAIIQIRSSDSPSVVAESARFTIAY